MSKTIRVSEETHQRLTEMGKKGESYNDILERLIRHHEVTKAVIVEPISEDCKEYQELLEHLNKVHGQVEKGETNEFVELGIKEKTR